MLSLTFIATTTYSYLTSGQVVPGYRIAFRFNVVQKSMEALTVAAYVH